MTIQKKLIRFTLAMSALVGAIFYVLVTLLPVDKVDEETAMRRALQLAQEIETRIAQIRAEDLAALLRDEAFQELPLQAKQSKVATVQGTALGPDRLEEIRKIVQRWDHTRPAGHPQSEKDGDPNYSFLFTEEQDRTKTEDDGHCWVLYNPSISYNPSSSRLMDLWNVTEENAPQGRLLVREANEIAVQKRARAEASRSGDGAKGTGDVGEGGAEESGSPFGIMRIKWQNPHAKGGDYQDKVIYIEPILGVRFRLPQPFPWPNPDSENFIEDIPPGDFAIWIGSGVYPDYQDIRQFTRRSGAVLLGVLGAALLFGALFVGRLGVRLARVRVSTESLKVQFVTMPGRFGEKNLELKPIGDDSKDEIGQFAQVFDEMGVLLAHEINFNRALWACFSDGLAITNQEGIVLDANQALRRMYGVDDVGQKPIADYLPEDEEGIKEYTRNPTDLNFVRRVNKKTNEEFYVSVSVAPIKGTSLRLHSVKDRTADYQMFRSMHAIGKGRILDSMMHTLGNQVHALSLETDGALLNVEHPAESLARIQGMVAGLRHFVTALRRLEQRNAAAEFHVTDAIADADDLLRIWVENRRVSLTVPEVAKCGLVKGLQGSMTLVLIHLIENAVDAIDENGSEERWIRVTVTVQDGEIVVRVQDSGPGLPPGALKAPNVLFRWGYSEKPNGRRKKGRGLGLYMSREIMKRDFKGSIKASNSASGGAMFELRLNEWRNDQ